MSFTTINLLIIAGQLDLLETYVYGQVLRWSVHVLGRVSGSGTGCM